MSGELIKVTGITEVQKMLAEAPKSVVARGFLKALDAGAKVFEQELEIRTPVLVSALMTVAEKGKHHPGDLRRALMSLVTLDSQFRGGEAAVGYGKQGFIANFVEYGHRMVTHKPGKKHIGQVPAHPFMRPTFDAKADAALDAFAESLIGTLKEGF